MRHISVLNLSGCPVFDNACCHSLECCELLWWVGKSKCRKTGGGGGGGSARVASSVGAGMVDVGLGTVRDISLPKLWRDCTRAGGVGQKQLDMINAPIVNYNNYWLMIITKHLDEI